MNRISFIIFITIIVVLGCLLGVACGDDDDSGDDDDDNDGVYRTCDDLPEAYGTALPMETLDCGGRLPLHRGTSSAWGVDGFDPNDGGIMVRDQKTLDFFQEAFSIYPQCTIDFDQYIVLVAWNYYDSSFHADTDTSICGVYEGDEGLRVPVITNVGSGADMYSSAIFYHFVWIERTEATAEFLTCSYSPESNLNGPGCGW